MISVLDRDSAPTPVVKDIGEYQVLKHDIVFDS